MRRLLRGIWTAATATLWRALEWVLRRAARGRTRLQELRDRGLL